MPLDLSTRHCGNVWVIQCSGSIVYGEEERTLEDALNHAEYESNQVVLNLSQIQRLDSMGLGLLVRHSTRLARGGGGIHLACSPEFVVRLLELTQIALVMPNFATEEDAVASFLRRAGSGHTSDSGPRVLVFDPSADLCSFARTVLSQRGFRVRTTCLLRDARLLLYAEPPSYILIGPGSAQLPAEVVANDLAGVAPHAALLRLSPNFRTMDALAASESLLQLFGIHEGSQLRA